MKNSPVFVSLLLLQFLSIAAFGQLKKSKILNINTTLYEGTITLLDGSKRSGQLNFNDNEGIVAFRSDDEVNYYNSKSIAGFEYHDPRIDRHRTFFVMEFMDPRVGMERYSFFEILKEFKSFAVLAKIDPVTADVQRTFGIPTNKAMSSKNNNNMVATQVETIYFMSEEDGIQPYIEIIEKETEKTLADYHRIRYRFLNEDLFEKYTRSFYPDLIDYAKANDLTFKVKSHLIKLLDHYEYLLSQ